MGSNLDKQELLHVLKNNKVFLNPGQRRTVEERIRNRKQFLENQHKSIYATERNIDKSEVIRGIREDEKLLQENCAPDVADSKLKNFLVKRQKQLEEFIKTGMPTKDEMMGERHSSPDNPNSKYQEAIPGVVDKNIAWEKRTGEAVQEWKRVKRVLDPENPSASNVENLRKIH